LDYTWARSAFTAVNNTALSILTSAGTTALTNGTLDMMKDVNRYPLDYSPYINPGAPPRISAGPIRFESKDANFRYSDRCQKFLILRSVLPASSKTVANSQRLPKQFPRQSYCCTEWIDLFHPGRLYRIAISLFGTARAAVLQRRNSSRFEEN